MLQYIYNKLVQKLSNFNLVKRPDIPLVSLSFRRNKIKTKNGVRSLCRPFLFNINTFFWKFLVVSKP